MSISFNPGITRIPPLGGGGGPLGTVTDFELVTTAATSVLTYTPAANGNLWVATYFRVQTAATDVTIQVTYTDAGGAQTLTLVGGSSQAVGSYAPQVSLLAVKAGNALTITATASTASQVFVSASILQG